MQANKSPEIWTQGLHLWVPLITETFKLDNQLSTVILLFLLFLFNTSMEGEIPDSSFFFLYANIVIIVFYVFLYFIMFLNSKMLKCTW